MSTQTQHLGLHQWEPDDDFLRTDFNQDFAKIDAGVKAAEDRSSMVKLMEVVLTETATQVELDVSGIRWEDYAEVLLYAQPLCAEKSIRTAEVLLNNVRTDEAYYMSNGGKKYYLGICYVSGTEEFGTTVLHFCCMCKQTKVHMDQYGRDTFSPNNYGQGIADGIKFFSDLKTININYGGGMIAGSQFYLYGVRK